MIIIIIIITNYIHMYIQEVLFQKEQGEEHQTQESVPTAIISPTITPSVEW